MALGLPSTFATGQDKGGWEWRAKVLFNQTHTSTFPTRQDNGGGGMAGNTLIQSTPHHHLSHPPRQRWRGNGWQKSYSFNPPPPPFPAVMTKVIWKLVAKLLFNQPPPPPPPSPLAKTKVAGKWLAQILFNQPNTATFSGSHDKGCGEMAGNIID